jgi:hypothetical protein
MKEMPNLPRHQNTRTAVCSMSRRSIGCRPSRVVTSTGMFLLEKLFDADQVNRVKFGAWVVVDEQVEIAGLFGLVAHGRTKAVAPIALMASA